MVILFEKLVREPQILDKLLPEDYVFLDEVYDYVESRLKPLQEEIEAEEANEEEGMPCCTAIRFPNGIGFFNYSIPLKAKMEQCFVNAERDVQQIWMKVSDRLSGLLN